MNAALCYLNKFIAAGTVNTDVMGDGCTFLTPLEKTRCPAVFHDEYKQTPYTTQCTTWNAVSSVLLHYVQ